MFLLRRVRFKSCALLLLVLLITSVSLTLLLTTGNRHHGNRVNVTSATAFSVQPPQQQQVTSVINMTLAMQQQRERQRHLTEACKRLGLGTQTPNFKTSDMYHNDTIKYIYCVVNKVACTSWKRSLLMASGQMTVDRPEQLSMTFVHNWHITDRYFPRIRYLTLDQVKDRLKTHFKFMFVRHPLERLVSTYRDKFTKKAYYYPMRFGRKIIRAIRGSNASELSLKRGHDVKFREMVQYLLDPPTTRHIDTLLSDNHWRPAHHLCHPCYIHYDFIGHYETLYQDAQAVLQLIGVSDRVQFPNTDPDNRWQKKTAEVSTRILQEISADELRRIKQLYGQDFELFDYNPDVFL